MQFTNIECVDLFGTNAVWKCTQVLIETNSHDLGSDFLLQTAHYGVKIF